MSEDLLSKEEKAALRKEVEDELTAEAKEEERARFKEIEKKKMKRRLGVSEPLEEIFIELPNSTNGITLDGHKFMVNHTYTVPKSQADCMREIMMRSWNHEAEINGRPKNFFTQRNTVLSPHGIRNAPAPMGLRV